MQFDERAEALSRYNAVSVRYKDRMWEIDLNSAKTGGHEASSLAFDLQAALNLASPPVGLQLHVAPGAEAVVCPLSVLVACPSYIATTFQGESKFVPQARGGVVYSVLYQVLCTWYYTRAFRRILGLRSTGKQTLTTGLVSD